MKSAHKFMRLATFEAVAAFTQARIADQRGIKMGDERGFGDGTGEVSFDTLFFIYNQQYQRHIRRTSHLRRKQMKTYLEWYHKGAAIYDIAHRDKVNFSSYLLARLFIENVLGVNKKEVSRLVKDTSRIEEQGRGGKGGRGGGGGGGGGGGAGGGKQQGEAERDARRRLRAEVEYCINMDQHCSPFVDRIRRNTGVEYE